MELLSCLTRVKNGLHLESTGDVSLRTLHVDACIKVLADQGQLFGGSHHSILKELLVKDFMVPLSEYVTVSKDATLAEAVTALKDAQENYDPKKYRHRAILVYDENKNVIGKISLICILRALEPKYDKMISDKRPMHLGFTRQYDGTLPYLYPIEMQLRWGMGWPLGLLAFVAFAWIIWITARPLWERWRRVDTNTPDLLPPLTLSLLILLIWAVPFFVTTGGFYVKFMRYLQPLTPLLMLFGAALILHLHDRRIRLLVLMLERL